MTICPFMSRPVPVPGIPLDQQLAFYEVDCQGGECAAWGPVARTLAGAAANGCRLIGGEVPE